MKKIFNTTATLLLVIISIYSCTDDLEKPVANAPINESFLITPDKDNITLNETNANTHTAITFNWSDSKTLYGLDTPAKFEVQMDSIDGNFSNPIVTALIDNKKSYTDAEMNFITIKLNLPPDVFSKIKVRLKATLQHGSLAAYSKVETISVKPYKQFLYAMPTELYIQGDAVASNWGYPVPASQKMTMIDYHRYQLVVELKKGKQFAFITSAAAWSDPAYKAVIATQPLTGGDFIPSGTGAENNNWGGFNMTAPAEDGFYKITLDFVTGRYTVRFDHASSPNPNPNPNPIPAELFLQGDAVASNWGYPISDSQKMNKINDHTFELVVALTGGKHFVFITSATAWTDPAYKAATTAEPSTGGDFVPVGTGYSGGFDITAPATSGNYKITVDFTMKKYTVTLITETPPLIAPPANLYIAGSATPLVWAAPDDSQKFTKTSNTFSITLQLTASGELAFITEKSTNWPSPFYRAKTNAEQPLGGNFMACDQSNNWGGSNIKAPPVSGRYTIIVDFMTGTYTLSLSN